jgi:hypothetical protein
MNNNMQRASVDEQERFENDAYAIDRKISIGDSSEDYKGVLADQSSLINKRLSNKSPEQMDKLRKSEFREDSKMGSKLESTTGELKPWDNKKQVVPPISNL